jgi:hypothetical protein
MKRVFSFEMFLTIDQNTQTNIPEGLQLHGFTGVMLSFRLSSKRYIVVEMSGNFSAKHSQSERQAGPARPWIRKRQSAENVIKELHR